jgi:L-ascorbate metabolism protein UlaG (beta-lactamase superfamily)
MPTVNTEQIKRWAVRTAIGAAATIIVVSVIAVLLWRDRDPIDSIDWHQYPIFEATADSVTVTWLGVSTLLFDDGETQILIDGFFSRPSLADIVLDRLVKSDAAMINRAIDEYRIRRLAAIIPVHSHYDHAMDIGAIANRSSASILGSETSANIARGAGVPEDQIVIVSSGAEYNFGQFTVTLIDSVHAPIGWGGSVPYAGNVDQPLQMPAPLSAWREGKNYSIVVSHPQGTTVVQGSAGFIDGALVGIQADTVMLGVSLLGGLGKDYTERYWQSLVTTTGAAHVVPIHFDDFTQPFGEIQLYPRALDDFVEVAGWLESSRQSWDLDARLHMPEFGRQVVLYPPASPET